jgi:hypothetical protein
LLSQTEWCEGNTLHSLNCGNEGGFISCHLYDEIKISLNHNLQLSAGHCITLRHKHSIWFHKSVRYAGLCSLQSAGEAQRGTAGNTTDPRLIRSELQRGERSTEGRRVSYSRENVPTYAESDQCLHMSTPEDKKVWSHITAPLIATGLTVYENPNSDLYYNVIFADSWMYWKIQWRFQCVDYSWCS